MTDVFSLLVMAGDIAFASHGVVRVVAVEMDGEVPPLKRTGAVYVSSDLMAREVGFVASQPPGTTRMRAADLYANADRCRVTVTEQQLRTYSQRAVIMLQQLLKHVSDAVVDTIQLVQSKNLGRKTEALFAGKAAIPDKTFIAVQKLASRFGKSSCDPFRRANSGQILITTQKNKSVETSVGQLNCICGLVEIGIDFEDLIKRLVAFFCFFGLTEVW